VREDFPFKFLLSNFYIRLLCTGRGAMSARKAAEVETSAEEVDPALDLTAVASGLALAHRDYAVGIANAMAVAAENAIALQQANGELALTATGKSVNTILNGPLPGLLPRQADNLASTTPTAQKDS